MLNKKVQFKEMIYSLRSSKYLKERNRRNKVKYSQCRSRIERSKIIDDEIAIMMVLFKRSNTTEQNRVLKELTELHEKYQRA